MTKIYHLLFVCLGVINTYAQTPNQESLINIHNINTLGDTSSINNPYQGSLIYVADIKTNYQYDGTKWELWYKSTAAPADTNTLTTLVDNISYPDTCCQFTQNLNICNPYNPPDEHFHNLYGSQYFIGDTVFCGVVINVHQNSGSDSEEGLDLEVWVIAPDEFIDVQWGGSGTNYPNEGGWGVDVGLVTSDCPTCYNASRICYEYQPEGCELDLNWQLPFDFYYLECYYNRINASLLQLGADLVYYGSEYWTGYDYQPFLASSHIMGTGAGLYINDNYKTEEKRVRPMARVQFEVPE